MGGPYSRPSVPLDASINVKNLTDAELRKIQSAIENEQESRVEVERQVALNGKEAQAFKKRWTELSAKYKKLLTLQKKLSFVVPVEITIQPDKYLPKTFGSPCSRIERNRAIHEELSVAVNIKSIEGLQKFDKFTVKDIAERIRDTMIDFGFDLFTEEDLEEFNTFTEEVDQFFHDLDDADFDAKEIWGKK